MGSNSKSKKNSSRSVNSNNSKKSKATLQASNVSSSNSSSASSSSSPALAGISRKRKSKQQRPLLPPTATKTPEPPPPRRQRAQSEPVDLDNLADNLSRAHHSKYNVDDEGLSPAETFDTVPLSASPSRSFGSRSGTFHPSSSPHRGSSSSSNNNDPDDSDNYLPVSLLNFDSPQAKGSKSDNESSNSSKVVIEHKIKDSMNNRSGNFRSRSAFCGGSSTFYLCLLKPALLILLLIALVSGASSLYGWLFKFPALNQQVEALEEQVVRLNAEVDRLESENDRYEVLNDRLNLTVDDLEDVRDDLNLTVTNLDDVANALNTTSDQIIAEVQELQTQNLEYAQLNNQLQAQVGILGDDLVNFRSSLEDLSEEHSLLQTTTNALQNLAMRFTNTTIDQNETLAVLQQTLEGFRDENDRLEDFNTKLETGLDYLNETLLSNGNLVESSAVALTEITRVLGEQVQQQQWSTLKQLEISYRQVLAGWDCDYRDVFRSKAFGQDFDTAILGTSTTEGEALLLPAEVQTYLGDRVFTKLCLDEDDFSKYLFALTVGEGRVVTSNQLIRAIVLYTEDTMQYYFPLLEAPESSTTTSSSSETDGIGNSDTLVVTAEIAPMNAASGQEGIILSEWIDATFRCELLESPFRSEVSDTDIGGIDVRRRKLRFSSRLRGGERQ